MHTDTPNDQASVEALRRGDEEALNRLMERWQGPLFAFAWRYVQNTTDARDLVAETFVRLYHQREKLRPDTKLAAWLFTTLTNLCHNQHRWRRRHPTVSLDENEEETGQNLAARTPSDEPSPSLLAERDEALRALRKALEELPHELKTTLILHHYEHLSYKEIAQITGCSERGVETRLYRAKQRLRELLSLYIDPVDGAGRSPVGHLA